MMQPPYIFWIRLTEDAHNLLVREFPPVHPHVFAHHVTLYYKPDAAQTAAMEEWLFEPVVVKVTGYYEDEKGQAVTVELPEGLRGNRSPHITISTAEGVEPVYSNELIEGDGERASGEVVGVVDAVYRKTNDATFDPDEARSISQAMFVIDKRLSVAEAQHNHNVASALEHVARLAERKPEYFAHILGEEQGESVRSRIAMAMPALEREDPEVAQRLRALEKTLYPHPRKNPRPRKNPSPTSAGLVARLKF